MPPTRALKVFLCHAHIDRDAVYNFYTHLIENGVDAWFDKEKLLPGSDWEYEIRKAVREADVVMVCLSKHFNQAGFRQKEVRLALDTAMEQQEGEIFIIPVRLEECDAPESLQRYHWVDLFEIDGYERILRALQIRGDKIGASLRLRNWLPKANPQSAVLKKLPTQIEKPTERKQEKPKLNKVIQTPKIFNITIIGIVSFVVFVLIAKFGLPSLIGKPPQSTYEMNVPLVICTPDSSLVNVYRATPQPWVNMIFEFAFPPIPTAVPPATPFPPPPQNEQQILSARYAAFLQLVNETKRWSDTQTIKLDDSSEVSITLTYISPELLQTVFLNEVLKNRFQTYGFQDQLQKVLNSVAERDELLFLATVTSANNKIITVVPHIKNITIDQMEMVNFENLQISPKHNDPVINQPINFSEPVFGYFTYPFAILSENQCKWILDPKYNTNITIIVPSIKVDGIDNGQYTWTIPYASIMGGQITHSDLLKLIVPPEFVDQNLMTPLTLPPSEINSDNNWRDFARFVWNQLMLGY